MLGLPQELSRKIVISTDIDEKIAYEVIERISEINDVDYDRLKHLVDYQPEPIEIFINSVGGNVTDGFAIIGAMELSDTPIITYGMGIVASMALAIFIAGDVRISSRHTRYLYHSISYGMIGHITEHEDMKEEAELLQRMYNSLIFDKTKITKEKLDEIRANKKDFYFSAKEAKKLGVVNDIIPKPDKNFKLANSEEENTQEQ